MDFCVEDDQRRIFDVEMQKRNEGNIPKRMRFYQALLDAPLLKSGEKSFDRLNQTYIIVICGFDLYGFGNYRYTFDNRCRELPDLSMGDACIKIVLNTKGKNASEVDRNLVDFLHYIEQSEEKCIPEDCDKRLRHLHEKVKGIKSNKQMGVTYMKMEERDRLIREEGVKKGIEEGIKEGIIALIETCKEFGLSRNDVLFQVETRFHLNREETEEYFEKYW